MYEFDERRDPLFFLRVRGLITPAERDRMRADVEALVDRRRPFVIIYDFADAEIPSPTEIRGWLKWARSYRSRLAAIPHNDAAPAVQYVFYMPRAPLLKLQRFMLGMMPSNRQRHAVAETLDEAWEIGERARARLELDDREAEPRP